MNSTQSEKLDSTATLKEAKEFLRKHYQKDGATCPCCLQRVKEYGRPLTGAMCYVLILVYKAFPAPTWLHVENYLKTTASGGKKNLRGDFHKLVHWKLLQKREGDHENGSPRNGYYRITPMGEAFVKGLSQVPSKVYIYNGKVQRFSKDLITIQDALGKHFDYNEIMQPTV